MKKIISLALAASLTSVFCFQSSAWSKSSLLLQIPAILAASKKTTTDTDKTEIYIGDDGVVTAFKGKVLRSDIKIFIGYAPDDGSNYTYTLISGPDGVSISSKGEITYDIKEDAATDCIPLSIHITRKETGKSYIKNAALLIMKTDIVASGTIGSEGGQIADKWNDIILTVPAGAVAEPTFFKVLSGVDKNGNYTYTTESSTDIADVLRLRLPDPLLRKAPQDEETSVAQQCSSPSSNKRQYTVTATESEMNWISWGTWYARYVSLYHFLELYNHWITNRVRNDLPKNEEPSGYFIINFPKKSAEIFSLCPDPDITPAAYQEECGNKEPVLFIHGYTLSGLGGGEGTWGKLPELIAAEGYAVFEFRWRTNARFVDVAAELADAIHGIQTYTGKKVHIIAHSFGGLLSRAYLQNYAIGRPYENNVQSFLTLGTPHSGIFDDRTFYKERWFPKGQDSWVHEWAQQISVHQAGEQTSDAWTVLAGKSIAADIFDIDENPGEFIAKIATTTGEHGMPVDTKVLIGLPIKVPADKYDYPLYYRDGDGLISYEGQRFHPDYGNKSIQKLSSEFGEGIVFEKILGVSDKDADAGPWVKVLPELVNFWGLDKINIWEYRSREVLTGYYHSTAIPDYHLSLYGAAEAYVENSYKFKSNFQDTGEPHAAYTEIKNWLSAHPSDDAKAANIALNLQVVDANTQQPVSGAKVYFKVNGSQCISQENKMLYAWTDSAGHLMQDENLTQELAFYPSSKYTALVIADGYHPDEFDTGYVTAATPELSGTEFGKIELRSTPVSTVTSATGRVWMDRNLGASRVATSMTDTEAYGDLYQWGRLADGHEKRDSGTTTTLSSTDVPGHDKFILSTSDPNDWRNPPNYNLWQGVNGINNPCPTGFRVPTADEWKEEIDSWSSKDAAGAFASPLKMVLAGHRNFYYGILDGLGEWGLYWSSTVGASYYSSGADDGCVPYVRLGTDVAEVTTVMGPLHADGESIRCIKD
jgi:uncharacterized protein (TIGR02145 family)